MKKTIIIRDNRDPLVKIRSICRNVYPKIDKYKSPILARKSVAHKLHKAINLLPGGLTFKILDAYRTTEEQKYYWNLYLNLLKEEYPKKSKKELLEFVKQYVHPWKGKYASGHLIGAALDLRLCYKRNGYKLPMESSKLNFQQNAQPYPNKLPQYLQRNRNLMYKVLSEVGFANYPKEYWHWSYGDIYWAESKKEKLAFYGIINSR